MAGHTDYQQERLIAAKTATSNTACGNDAVRRVLSSYRHWGALLSFLQSVKTATQHRQHVTVLQLGEYYLPKGTPVHINLWAIQHDERYWQEAQAFKPERWVGDKTGGDRTGGMAYMPFGMGPRMCIGIKLARKFWQYST